MIRKRVLLVLAALALFGCARGTDYGISLDISSAPPPPRFVFSDRPEYVAEYDGGVYVADASIYDLDLFRYGSYWYTYSNGYWYRSNRYNGPYVVIEYRSVPRRIMRVPESRWRHYYRS